VARRTAAADRRTVTLSLTPAGLEAAHQVQIIEQEFYQALAELVATSELDRIKVTLWRFVAGRPSGNALAHRQQKW